MKKGTGQKADAKKIVSRPLGRTVNSSSRGSSNQGRKYVAPIEEPEDTGGTGGDGGTGEE